MCYYCHVGNNSNIIKIGYLALVHARAKIGRAARLLITAHGVHHGPGGDHLLAEVNIDTGDNHFVSSGVRRVQDGLSFPTRDAPRRYHQALETAYTRGRGVFQFGPDMGQEQLMP